MKLTSAQEKIININNKTMLVSASAGSGKTFVVTEKIIKEIVEDRIDIDSFLILTFTNLAASELKERIKKGLYRHFDTAKKNKDADLVKYIHNQISKLPNANISTIHSFCLKVIRENFNYLNIDPLVTTLEESKASIMINETLTEVLDGLYDIEDTTKKSIFFDILEIYGNEENLKNNLLNIYYKYKNMQDKDSYFESIENLYKTLDETKDLIDTDFGFDIVTSMKQKADLLIYEIQNILAMIPNQEEYLSRKEILEYMVFNLTKISKANTFNELLGINSSLKNVQNLPKKPEIDKKIKDLILISKKKVKIFTDYLSKIAYKDSKECIKDLKKTYPYIQFQVQIIKLVSESYELKKKSLAVIEFSDYEHLSLKALNNEAIRLKYREKYKKIYIDEYQDTSLLQEEIITKISKADNLVMVGDIKQSIYGFRNASPQLFETKYKEFKEIEELEKEQLLVNKCKVLLSVNFRSRKEVIDSINDIFEKIMEKDFGSTNYTEKEKLGYANTYPEVDDTNYKTEIHIVENTANEINNTEATKVEDINIIDAVEDIKKIEKESIFVAKRIQDLINNKFKIYDSKTQKSRDILYKDIVVLMRSTQNKANIVETVLKENNIPVYTDTKEGFFKSDEILLIYSFLKVLDNPFNDIAVVSIMFSAIGRFGLDEIYKIKESGKSKEYMYDILKKSNKMLKDSKLMQKVNDFIELLDRFTLYTNTYNVGKVISLLYEETKIYDLIGLEEENAIKKMNLDSFVKIAYDFEEKESKGIGEFIKYIAKISKSSKASESPKIIGENENVVRVMTIHKSKGLEFPVVILMNTASKYNINQNMDLLQIDPDYGLGFNVFEKDLKVTYPSIITKRIKQKQEEESLKEEIRLLYVALTRAKEKLIIFGSVNNYERYIEDIYDFSDYEKIPYSIKINIKNHLKCMLYSILNSDMKNFDIIVHNSSSIKDTISKLNYSTTIKNDNNIFEDFEILAIQKSNKIKELVANIGKELEKKYNYKDTTRINQKYTVTGLKAEIVNESKQYNLETIKPNILVNEIDAASYGTLFHKTIQKLFSNKEYKTKIFDESYIQQIITQTLAVSRLKTEKKIKERLVADLKNLLLTEFADYIKHSVKVYSELEFVLKSNLSELDILSLEEETLIQGVVDMYIKTVDNKNIIIDFKTDFVTTDKELIDRYKYQLIIYKIAIERIKSVKIENMYIYSTNLKRLISVC